MAWQIDTDPRPGCLMVRISGDADARVAGEIVAGVFREMAAHKCSRLLIDVRDVKGRMSIWETFSLVSGHPPMQGVRAAILDRLENREWYEFYETVSVNRGYHNRVFTDFDEAVAWLDG